ncbi:hypothetical protein [Methylobacterium sp. GC_Met_2]|uniref:hypothetical protein n=1 Tax=Methylobacterium sp. GC_Met_2 TaxID=2937376 RepID=UPI00226B4F60|nr:hypothetical protein [Methylobacterium sp. GC_Met_2]
MLSLSAEPSSAFACRSLRPLVEAIAAEAEADRRRHRTRKRARGDCSKSFFDDGDRFALAAMVAMQLASEEAPMSFGGRRSDWSSARHAAALFAPGRGQRVAYAHRLADGSIIAKADFAAGPERHETAARRLARKHKTLEGLAAAWVSLSGCLLATLNSSAKSGARAHSRALLGVLGWRDVSPLVWLRLGQLLARSEINHLAELFVTDRP